MIGQVSLKLPAVSIDVPCASDDKARSNRQGGIAFLRFVPLSSSEQSHRQMSCLCFLRSASHGMARHHQGRRITCGRSVHLSSNFAHMKIFAKGSAGVQRTQDWSAHFSRYASTLRSPPIRLSGWIHPGSGDHAACPFVGRASHPLPISSRVLFDCTHTAAADRFIFCG